LYGFEDFLFTVEQGTFRRELFGEEPVQSVGYGIVDELPVVSYFCRENGNIEADVVVGNELFFNIFQIAKQGFVIVVTFTAVFQRVQLKSYNGTYSFIQHGSIPPY